MEKFLLALIALLGASVAYAIFRKLRGGRFLPAPDMIDGKPEPQTLKELVETRRERRAGE